MNRHRVSLYYLEFAVGINFGQMAYFRLS